MSVSVCSKISSGRIVIGIFFALRSSVSNIFNNADFPVPLCPTIMNSGKELFNVLYAEPFT